SLRRRSTTTASASQLSSTSNRQRKSLHMGGSSNFENSAYFFAVSPALAYLRRNRSTRPAVSINFCLPVKKGWQAEQISTWMSPRCVDRVVKLLPQAHCTRISLYAG